MECLQFDGHIYVAKLKKLVWLGYITQDSLAEITNQMFSLKCQMFRQLAAAFISGSGSQSVHVLNV